MNRFTTTLGAALASTVLLAACSPSSEQDPPPPAGAGQTCLADDPDCADTGGDMGATPPPSMDEESDEPTVPETGEVDEAAVQARAQELLGAEEAVLELEQNTDVRVARRGEESFAMTEDYVIGRITVELDDADADGTFTITTVVMELSGGHAALTLDGEEG